ncbi:MAG: DUF6265 family protein [Acidobacteriota bacterium]
MKRLVFAAVSLLSAVVIAVPAERRGLNELAMFSGCWERSDKNGAVIVSEQWMKPAGTSILGMGRTVRDGKTVDHEFMRIENRADGLYFVARPKANAEETEFKLKSRTANSFTFENPEHDFPQRVIYSFGNGTMTGRIEGNNKGKPMGIDFPFKKVKCD